MSIFIENKLNIGNASAGIRYGPLVWHSKQPILALATFSESSGGQVSLFSDDAQRLDDGVGLKKLNVSVSAIAWHPDKKILATGWNNGELTLWNVADGLDPVTVGVTARSNISHLLWSSNGFRILVADVADELLEYKIDNRGSPHSSPFVKLKLPEAPRIIILKPPPRPKSREGDERVASIGAVELENGDALDAFSRSKGGHEAFFVSLGSNESATFFIGGSKGTVQCLRESGSLQDCFVLSRPILQLLYLEDRNMLITISEDLMLHQHQVTQGDNRTEKIIQIKLSEKLSHFCAIWCRYGIMAMSSGEPKIRLWDLENENNSLLQLQATKGYTVTDSILTIASSSSHGILAAGTAEKRIALWRFSREGLDSNGEENEEMELEWKLESPMIVESAVQALVWSPSRPVLAVVTASGVLSIKEQSMLSHLSKGVGCVQRSRSSVMYVDIESGKTAEIKCEQQIKGVRVFGRNVALWGHGHIYIHQVDEAVSSSSLLGSFPWMTSNNSLAVTHQNVYMCIGDRVDVVTFQGTVKQVIRIGEEEGEPAIVNVSGQNHLVLCTSKGFCHIYDLSRREARESFPSKMLATGGTDWGSLVSAQINSTGTKISYVVRSSLGLVDPRIYVFDAETDQSFHFNLTTGLSDQAEFESNPESKSVEARFAVELRNRVPGEHFWDEKDNRLLCVEALPPSLNPKFSNMSKEVVSFFVTSDLGILVQDVIPIGSLAHSLIGLHIPFYYFNKKGEADVVEKDEESIGPVVRKIAKEFVGLEKADQATTEAMLNFSFHLTTGNMDEAFKSIKLIKSEGVWENMAEMCVKTERLDVAAVCLGKMGHARGARVLRKASKLPANTPKQVKVAALAVQLNLVDEAGKLYQQCGRFDLLNRLHQTKNNWKQAIELSQSEDRIHMRNTFYSYASHLESIGAVEGAIDNYEKSETHSYEVPRMLFDNPFVLEQYVKKNRDRFLLKWWAQYLESSGEIDGAKNFYVAAKDYLAVVRLLCYIGDVDAACTLANETGEEAACYHLARQFENAGDYNTAVDFFTKAQAYASAIRLCKEHELSEKMAHLCLMSSDADMMEAAKYYQDKPGQADKAVMLYHKAGMLGRALELAFKTEQHSALDLIINELDENSDPNVLERSAEFFAKNYQHAKAVQLLSYAKKYREAVTMCVEKNVPMTEELAESLTPKKEAIPNAVERNGLLEELADLCIQQGHYHIAAKKYTQAGMKTQAMRALLKSGDTDKIIFFANTARSKDIYIMAANYLQTTEWKANPDTMKHILTFYTKGGSPQLLAGFYRACAEVEIEEYRDYEKALVAYQEGARCLSKAEDSSHQAIQTQEKIQEMNSKVALIRKFLNIRSVYETDPSEAMKQLTELASEPNINDAVRLGDIYAVLIIHNVKKENFKKAHGYIEELRKRLPNSDLSRFIKEGILMSVYEELNLPYPWASSSAAAGAAGNGQNPDGGEDETVQESMALKRTLTATA